MKKTNVDLIVGASILAALFVLVAGMVWLKEASLARQMVYYVVIFPEVGTLQLGDPVYVNGVKKGSVAKIDLRGTEVAAVLHLDKKVRMTDSTRVAVVNVGLLGERGVGVTLSASGNTIPHLAPGADTTFIRGEFHTGISEAMAMLGNMVTEAETLIVSLSDVVGATVGDSVFIVKFHRLVGQLDTTLDVANRMLRRAEPPLNAALADLRVASNDLKDLIKRNEAGIDSIVVGGNQLMTTGVELVERADSLVGDIQGMLRRIESGEGSLGKLYKDEDIYRDLKGIIAGVDTLVTEIKDDALKLRIRLGFGRGKKKND